MPSLFDRFGRPRRQEAFGGAAYCAVNVASDDSVRQFTTESVKLRDAAILARNHPQLIGHFDLQDLHIAAGDHVKLSRLDASTIYVTNATPGSNGTLVILGARE
ncbi:MAG: hypothetical protein ACNA7X_04310 [Dehalococcoidia bacterium]